MLAVGNVDREAWHPPCPNPSPSLPPGCLAPSSLGPSGTGLMLMEEVGTQVGGGGPDPMWEEPWSGCYSQGSTGPTLGPGGWVAWRGQHWIARLRGDPSAGGPERALDGKRRAEAPGSGAVRAGGQTRAGKQKEPRGHLEAARCAGPWLYGLWRGTPWQGHLLPVPGRQDAHRVPHGVRSSCCNRDAPDWGRTHGTPLSLGSGRGVRGLAKAHSPGTGAVFSPSPRGQKGPCRSPVGSLPGGHES